MRATGRMHSARLESSPRLQAVLAFLRGRGDQGATTRDIIDRTGMCAINSIIDELRDNGIQIAGEWITAAAGGRAFRYRIVTEAPVQKDLFR